MATTIPTVTVAPVEAGNGYTIICSACPTTRLMRKYRADADIAARAHQASHTTWNPVDGSAQASA